MIKEILHGIGRFLLAICPYVFLSLTALIIIGTQRDISTNLVAVKAAIEDQQVNEENIFNAVLETDLALAQADVNIAKQLDQQRKDAAKQGAALVKTIYAVDKNAIARDQGIVDGVNTVVDGVNDALQKPSYEYLKNITVKILAKSLDPNALPGHKGWMGTGVIIALTPNYTYILTCRHVVGEADTPYDTTKYHYYVKDGDNKYTFTPIKVSQDDGVDLALIRINGHIDGKIAVIGFGTVKEQDPVYMVGMDLGRPFFYSEGTVAGFDPEEGDELVVGMPVGPGNSGSGVINKQGGLVGLLYAGSIIDQEGIDEMDIAHGLCVPIKAIRLFLADYIQ